MLHYAFVVMLALSPSMVPLPITIANVYDLTCAYPNMCLPQVGRSDTFSINFFNNATKSINVKIVFQTIDNSGYTDSIQFQNATLKPGDGIVAISWMPQAKGVDSVQAWLVDPFGGEPVLESNGYLVLYRVV